ELQPAQGQVPHLVTQIRQRSAAGQRTLVTTLTKRLAEDLAAYLQEQGIACAWLHSELDAFERVELLRGLREGEYDVLVGVNLLREGLDLPEVSLVAILDADKEGFLRSETSLVQTIGRSARNVDAKVILYADKVTESMQRAIDETARRRAIQEAYNREHGITPETVRKRIQRGIEADAEAHRRAAALVTDTVQDEQAQERVLEALEKEMREAAEALEFERAAAIRDRILELKEARGESVPSVPGRRRARRGAPRRRRSGGKKVPRPKQP
ncbi:MAG TPA: excinuclease ABC subunit B, partial [Planctomycetaceae bacterium]|nr:excinuclease ABC subunit B [Planctomycetaceae bacterium]